MLWYVKSSDFRAEEFALDYDHLRVFFTRSDFFSCSRGWRTILDALTYRYSFSFISLSLSQAEMTTIIPNMISRNHGNIAILCETQLGLPVLLRKNRDSTATDIHYRERTDLWTTAKEAISVYFNMTFPCLTWIISKLWPRKTFKFFVKLRELNPYKYWSPGGSFLQRN